MKTLRLLLTSIADLFLPMLPQMKRQDGVAFLVHPRDLKDVSRKYPFARFVSDTVLEHILTWYWPVTLSRITGVQNKNTKRKINGWVISIPLTAAQMMENPERARRSIHRAMRLARRRGAYVIGLGALTASLTKGGLDLRGEDVFITTGRLYTSHIVTQTLMRAFERLGVKKDKAVIGIVGAAGSIGAASAQILAREGFRKFILVDLSGKNDRMQEIQSILKTLEPEVEVMLSNTIEDIRTADGIVAVTNRPDALIRSEHLKPGAVVVDDAQPSDVDPKIIKTRNDVLILEGGVAHSDYIDPHFNFGLKHKTDIFSCLAEAIILAANDIHKDFQVGQVVGVDFDALEFLQKQEKEMGLRVGDFQYIHKVYSEEDIEKVQSYI